MLNNYSLNISENVYLRTKTPFKFDDLMRIIVSSYNKYNSNIGNFIQALNVNGFILDERYPKSLTNKPVNIDTKIHVKHIKLLFAQGVLIFIDPNYELMYSFGKKTLSILVYNNKLMIVSKKSITNMSELLEMVRNHMSKLCDTYENNPQATPSKDKRIEKNIATVMAPNYNTFDDEDTTNKNTEYNAEDSIINTAAEVQNPVKLLQKHFNTLSNDKDTSLST